MSASFCASPLWDLELSWNTTNPDFTPCFHQSVLTYIPTILLIIGIPFQVVLLQLQQKSSSQFQAKSHEQYGQIFLFFHRM